MVPTDDEMAAEAYRRATEVVKLNDVGLVPAQR
jgi:hypothetical protein